MSMLSKQCEELRAEAERIGYWSPTASRLMFDAADILWSLRNKNVALLGENESLQAENAKLRELCRHLYACNQYCDREDSDGGCSACPYQPLEYDCGFEERLLELGIEVEL